VQWVYVPAVKDAGEEGEEGNQDCQVEYFGNIFFDVCDNQSYYLVRTDDNKVYDPYFEILPEGGPVDGARMKFTFKPNNILSCADEGIPGFVSAIDVCTYEFLETPPSDDDLFDDFPWLEEACVSGATISLHNYIADDYWKYLLVNHNDNLGTYTLYLQTGSFYAHGSSENNILETLAYYIDVNEIVDSVTCGQ